ncbi:MAG: N-acetylglucosamine-6-phosphate deacetylase [Rhodospirillales bacterium]|nr:N-acetylglucosamine-6-phosphate deacetylase [Rhodospirillales bacterium]
MHSTSPKEDDQTTLGLVDVQVNGFAGVDFNSDGLTAEELDCALTAMLATGVTRCLPTIITAAPDRLRARLVALDTAVRESRLGPWMVDGIHLEGPFLSPEDGYAGCHPTEAMRPPSLEVFDKLTANLAAPVRLITVAPELDGAIPFIEALSRRGTVVALGHSSATHDVVKHAADAGARMSTHLGNAISHLLEKNNNTLFAQLGEDRLAAGFIADGAHIPPYMLQSWIRAKEPRRTVLVTDATAAAAAEPGMYTLGDLGIERGDDGVVREPGSPYLAGSSATLDGCIRNVMRWFGYDFAAAFAMARNHPLSILNLPTAPAVGDAAEFVRWSREGDEWRVIASRIGPWQVG